MNMTSKEQVKIIMLRENLTAKKLAAILVEKTGKHYTQSSILNKISTSSFRYDEVKTIADIFGYKITIEKD